MRRCVECMLYPRRICNVFSLLSRNIAKVGRNLVLGADVTEKRVSS